VSVLLNLDVVVSAIQANDHVVFGGTLYRVFSSGQEVGSGVWELALMDDNVVTHASDIVRVQLKDTTRLDILRMR
jgi:hypothetical protein